MTEDRPLPPAPCPVHVIFPSNESQLHHGSLGGQDPISYMHDMTNTSHGYVDGMVPSLEDYYQTGGGPRHSMYGVYIYIYAYIDP